MIQGARDTETTIRLELTISKKLVEEISLFLFVFAFAYISLPSKNQYINLLIELKLVSKF